MGQVWYSCVGRVKNNTNFRSILLKFRFLKIPNFLIGEKLCVWSFVRDVMIDEAGMSPVKWLSNRRLATLSKLLEAQVFNKVKRNMSAASI